MKAVLERLAVPATHLETGGARTAARQLDEALAASPLATIDCQTIGYWHQPAEMEGRGDYPWWCTRSTATSSTSNQPRVLAPRVDPARGARPPRGRGWARTGTGCA